MPSPNAERFINLIRETHQEDPSELNQVFLTIFDDSSELDSTDQFYILNEISSNNLIKDRAVSIGLLVSLGSKILKVVDLFSQKSKSDKLYFLSDIGELENKELANVFMRIFFASEKMKDIKLHTNILDLGVELGYFEAADGPSGACNGITLSWIEACMINDEDTFIEREEIIVCERNILQRLENIKNKIKSGENLTEDEEVLSEVPAFYEKVSLYQSAKEYRDLFNESLSQTDIDAMSPIASSEETQKAGGLKKVYSQAGVYSKEEFLDYLNKIKEVIDDNDFPPESSIGIQLTNHEHSIGLVYRPNENTWRFMDINQGKPIQIKQGEEQKLWEHIQKGLKSKLTGDYIPLNASIITTGIDAKNTNLPKKLSRAIQRPVVTNDFVKREGINELLIILGINGDCNLVGVIARKGVDLGVEINSDGDSLAHIAAQRGHLSILKEIQSAGVDLTRPNNDGMTPLHWASKSDHSHLLDFLLADGIDINSADLNGLTPMHYAASNDSAETLKALYQRGAALNTVENNGLMPAHYAVQKGCERALGALLDLGIDPNQIDQQGMSLFDHAIHSDQAYMIKVLADRGVSINHQDEKKNTAAHECARLGRVESIKVLASLGVQLDSANIAGLTPAHIAVASNQLDIIEALYDLGANIDIPSVEGGLTPYDLANLMGKHEVINKIHEIYRPKIEKALAKFNSICPDDNDKQLDEYIKSTKDVFNAASPSEKREILIEVESKFKQLQDSLVSEAIMLADETLEIPPPSSTLLDDEMFSFNEKEDEEIDINESSINQEERSFAIETQASMREYLTNLREDVITNASKKTNSSVTQEENTSAYSNKTTPVDHDIDWNFYLKCLSSIATVSGGAMLVVGLLLPIPGLAIAGACLLGVGIVAGHASSQRPPEDDINEASFRA
ncbi:MAG: ankyrin repeat domain-containing protein [Legionellaceae bacterium]|nr:ankyrin repeat domain-containing protein [Legionellaceae bacterium]